jgi:hypothetical protein
VVIEHIPRLGDDRVRLDEVAEGRVIPAGAVVVQPQAGLFALAVPNRHPAGIPYRRGGLILH